MKIFLSEAYQIRSLLISGLVGIKLNCAFVLIMIIWWAPSTLIAERVSFRIGIQSILLEYHSHRFTLFRAIKLLLYSANVKFEHTQQITTLHTHSNHIFKTNKQDSNTFIGTLKTCKSSTEGIGNQTRRAAISNHSYIIYVQNYYKTIVRG